METVSLAGVMTQGLFQMAGLHIVEKAIRQQLFHQRATLFSMVPTSHPHCKIIMF